MANTLYLNIPQVSANQNQKEVTINSGIAALEAALCSSLIITFASANVTLTPTQFAGNIMFRVQGTLAGNSLVFPSTVGGNATNRLVCVTNETLNPAALSMGSGTTINLPGGVNAFVFVNGLVGCVLLATSANLSSLVVNNGTTAIDRNTSSLTFSTKFTVTDTTSGAVAVDINNTVLGALSYQGTWNAATNVPALVSSTGTNGWFYTVATAGTTALNGINQWNVGDKVIFDGTVWEKIDGISNEVLSVAGRTGTIVLSVADVSGAAPLFSPIFTGAPSTPTPPSNDNSYSVPNTAWVSAFILAQGYTTALTVPVTSVEGMTGAVVGLEQVVHKGVWNGYAGLDSSGKVPLAQLPASVAGALSYQGTWDATANAPALASSTGTKGYFYTVSNGGSTALDGIAQWNVGDNVVFNGTVWEKIDGIANEVISVAGKTGTVTLLVSDVTGAAPSNNPNFSGVVSIPTPLLTDDSNAAANTAWVASFLTSQGYVTAAASPVTSVAGKTGTVTLSFGDISGAAPLLSPNFTGNPTVPVPPSNDNSLLATNTTWVQTFVASLGYVTAATCPVTSVNGTTGAIVGLEQTSNKAAANGYASLDGSGKVPLAQLPAAVAGALSYQGTWNASTNVPALVSSTGTKGYFYTVSTAGGTTLDGVSQWNVGDKAVFDGTVWEKIDGITNEVLSVAGMTGAVTLTASNIGGLGALATLNVGTGLTSSSGSLSVSYGTAAGTAAQGNDTRITGAEQTANKNAVSGYCGLDSNGLIPWAQMRPEVQTLPLAFIIPGLPAAAQVYNLAIATAVTIPANLAGTVVYDTTQPTASAIFTVNHISGGTTTAIGTITVTTTSHTSATLSTQVAVSLAVGDVLQLVAPTSQDATLANVGITILAAKV